MNIDRDCEVPRDQQGWKHKHKPEKAETLSLKSASFARGAERPCVFCKLPVVNPHRASTANSNMIHWHNRSDTHYASLLLACPRSRASSTWQAETEQSCSHCVTSLAGLTTEGLSRSPCELVASTHARAQFGQPWP